MIFLKPNPISSFNAGDPVLFPSVPHSLASWDPDVPSAVSGDLSHGLVTSLTYTGAEHLLEKYEN